MMIRQAGGAKQPAIYFMGRYLNNSRTVQEAIQNAAETMRIVSEEKRKKDEKEEEKKRQEIEDINKIALEVAQKAPSVLLRKDDGMER